MKNLHKSFVSASVLAIAATLSSQAGYAETVTIPLGQQGKAWGVETPRHGTSKADVESRFGAPSSKRGPIGDPPIYTWDYGNFSVYFESDRVIHSVVKHQSKN